MRTLLAAPILLLFVLFTIILPNHHLITRIKSNLTLTELEASDLNGEKILAINVSHAWKLIPVTLSPVEIFQPTLLIVNDRKVTNPTLNFLYLAHSPPAYT